MSDFSTNLKRCREKAALSQEVLAEKLALSRQTVSDWEADVSFPDLSTVEQLAAALQVTPDDLLYPTADSQPSWRRLWLLEVPLLRYAARAILVVGGLRGISECYLSFFSALRIWALAFLAAMIFFALDQILFLLGNPQNR